LRARKNSIRRRERANRDQTHVTDPDTAPATFEDLLTLLRRLLADDGCPWDRAQTPRSLLPYLLEEAYEVREAVLGGDDAGLLGELGDLALHVAFQAVLAERRGAFAPAQVFERILEKMVRRHPHVFGEAAGGTQASGPLDPVPWEELKRRERSAPGEPARLLQGIPRALPALLKAQRLQERAASVGFDWPDVLGALAKLREELAEVSAQLDRSPPDAPALEEELGDLLFAVVNVARKARLVAEDALERANAKFRRRFERVEDLAAERGLDVASAGLAALDALWEEVKRVDDGPGGRQR
jgi:MazG family protein